MKPLALTAELGLLTGNYSAGSLNADPTDFCWQTLADPSLDRLSPSFVALGKAVYAYGSVNAKFPGLSLEREFYQALESVPPRSPADQFNVENTVDVDILNQELNRTHLLYSVLRKPENIYIAREMVWIFQDRAGLMEYVIAPENDEHVSLLVTTIAPGRDGLPGASILIGELISPTSIAGLIDAPTVRLVALRKPLVPVCGTDDGTFQQVQSLLINQGAANNDRALNFVLLNHGDFYATSQNLLQPVRGTPTAYGFTVVEARTLSRRINHDEVVDVIFIYAPETSGPRIQYYSLVNVTGLFPFIVVPFTKYLPRV
jgi:hypothetical protein